MRSIAQQATVQAAGTRDSGSGTVTTSTKGMYGKGLPNGGEDRKGKGK